MNRRIVGIAVTVVALIAVIVVAIAKGGGGKSHDPGKHVVALHGLIGSEKAPFFADPKVQQAFKDAGYDVQVDTAGSRAQLAADPKKYDFFFPSSAPVATELAAKTGGKSFAPFYSPIVIYSFTDIANLLRANGLVKDVAGVPTFDVAAYEALVKAGTRWSELKGNSTYPASKTVLATTTNPDSSNSALMFASLAAYVANGGRVVTTQAEVDKVAAAIRPLFVDQGYKESSSEGPFEDYLALGKGKVPLLVGYESQLLALRIAHDPRLTNDMTVLYPSPGLISKHTLVSTDVSGAAIGQLLLTDPTLVKAEATYGFRPSNANVFRQTLATAKVSAPPDLTDYVDPSPYGALDLLVAAIDK